MHGYLTIAVEPAAPHKVVDFGMRAAKPEEIKGAPRGRRRRLTHRRMRGIAADSGRCHRNELE
jgi:hypothetical protein